MTAGMLLLLVFAGFVVYMGLLILVGERWGGKGVATFAVSSIVLLVATAVILSWEVPL